jgi:hypothetical protein
MHKSATECNETLGKWCKNKHGASKIMDTLETYHRADSPNRCTHFNGLKVMGGDFHARESTPLPCIYSVLVEILSRKLILCVLLSGRFVCYSITVNRPPMINYIA